MACRLLSASRLLQLTARPSVLEGIGGSTVSCRHASNSKTVTRTGSMTRQERMRPKAGDPMFKEVWRKFQLKVHPDLFSQFPELQKVNADSLQRLQGLLNEVKSLERPEEDRVRARLEKLQFFVRAPAPAGVTVDPSKPHFLKVPVNIQINGEYAHNSLATSLSKLFTAVGLPPRFHWGPEFFSSTYKPTAPPPPEEDDDEEGRGQHDGRGQGKAGGK